MIKLPRILVLSAALLLAAAAANTQTPAAGNAAPTGDAKHGKELFVKDSCYACHGFSGQNGNGARLVPMKFPQAGFIAYVRNPPRANQMPSFSTKVLTDADLADIYAYIKTLPDSSPAPGSIPILNQILGQLPQ
jgi:ubiquinol-cytochrome c reductase cytochrome c subunit